MLHHVYQFSSGRFSQKKIHVVTEVPFTITVNGHELATMMCTPVKLRELALGFLAFERFIDSMADVKSIEVDEEEAEVHVELNKPLLQIERRIFTSGCGGGLTFHLDIHDYPVIRTGRVIDPAMIAGLIEKLTAAALLYHQSRGIHTAALSDGKELVAVAEDVGRHNALDKLRGETLERGIDTRDYILISTGRISSEMLRKAARMNVPFVVSRTSPTSLSIAVAKRLGITLIGYARPGRFNVYSHPENLGTGEARAGEERREPRIRVASRGGVSEGRGEPVGEAVPSRGREPGAPLNGREVPPPPAVRRGLRRGQRKGGGAGRKKEKEFLDVADQAFAHQMAISVWREAEAVLESAPSFDEGIRCLRELGDFADRGEFAFLWKGNWLEALGRLGPAATPPERLEILRGAVLKSVEEEDEARQRAGRSPIICDDEGRRFIDFALGRLFEEASGEIEEMA